VAELWSGRDRRQRELPVSRVDYHGAPGPCQTVGNMTVEDNQNPAAGWYPDKRGGHRWWDGSEWTDYRRNADGDTFTEPGPKSQLGTRGATSPSKLGTILGYLGAIVLFFTTFSRWMTTSEGRAYNAFDRLGPWFLTGADWDAALAPGLLAHGVIFMLFALASLGLVVVASQGRMNGAAVGVLGIGGCTLLLVIINAFTFRSAFGPRNEVGQIMVGTGIGFWLAALAALALIASGVLLNNARG